MLKQGLAVIAAMLIATPAVALDDPESLVREIYALELLPSTPAAADRYLSADMAEAYKTALQADEPRPGTDADWRYDAQDWEITDLEIGRARDVAAAANDRLRQVDVRVTFRNFGQPMSIDWTLCLGREGWRVSDVTGNNGDGPWRLREFLELPDRPVRC